MSTTALVIGGTGPTGPHIVNGLLERGWQVAILHTGKHESPAIPAAVEHIHTNPFDPAALAAALATQRFDLTIATYGRLREVAPALKGKTGRFISVGGGPAYRGYMNGDVLHPRGLPVPTPESAPVLTIEAEDTKGFRVRLSEEVVFAEHPDATHFRYPFLYGPGQLAPREWCVVRRVLDRRPFIVLPDAGLSLNHFGGAENVAHAVLLAVDQPAVAAGQIYNCGDEQVLTLRQVVDVIAAALDWQWEVISMPYELAVPARPLIAQASTTHRVFDLTKLKAELGYRDQVPPVVGVAAAARWLAEHPLPPGGTGERIMQDPFDYAAEDALVAAWRRLRADFEMPVFSQTPGYTASYSGPGGSTRRGSL